MSKKYYVVFVGRKPGIYETWDGCKAQVDGFKGAAFKSFKTIEEATAATFSIMPENNETGGWKPDSEYPKETQDVLKRIRG